MTPIVDVVAAALERRAARATALAATTPSAAGLLTYYAHLSEVQRGLTPHVTPPPEAPAEAAGPSGSLARRIDTGAVAALVPALLPKLQAGAPPTLRRAMLALAAEAPLTWQARLDASLATDDGVAGDAPAAFVCEVVLQPFAEAAARAMPLALAARPGPGARCPCCGGRPVMGVLRERGHGAGRGLVCGRCLHEWAAPRLVCPSCGGMEVAALPVFRADRWPAARLDACEQCRAYLKSVDLTVDGAAIAVVDDLATLPLDLWAAEEGFHKLRPNLLRL